MNDAPQVAELFHEVAQLNYDDPLRQGSLLEFPNYGQAVMTGDLHGNRRNFDKLQKYCDLERAGARHVMLHEIIHEDVTAAAAHDMSHEVLCAAAMWKRDYPDQVHFLQSNHELAQLGRHEITKNGRIVTVDFEEGIAKSYPKQTDLVIEAIDAFLRSYPLAGRTRNRVFLSHSLPSPRNLPCFDAQVLSRVPTDADLADRGSGHMLVWGRYQTDATLEALADLLDVDYFICGHQPQEMGYDVVHDRLIILASEHNHGVFLPVDLNKPTNLEKLVSSIRRFVAVA